MKHKHVCENEGQIRTNIQRRFDDSVVLLENLLNSKKISLDYITPSCVDFLCIVFVLLRCSVVVLLCCCVVASSDKKGKG